MISYVFSPPVVGVDGMVVSTVQVRKEERLHKVVDGCGYVLATLSEEPTKEDIEALISGDVSI